MDNNESFFMDNVGLRFNEGKLRYDLLHPEATKGLVKVLTAGAKKYTARNWEKGMSWTSVIASLKRHLAAIEAGEDYDNETGLLHADHIQCNSHFLSAYYKIAPQHDDRLHSYLKIKKIGLDVDEVICDWVGYWCKYHNTPVPKNWNFDFNIRQKFESLKEDKDFWMSIPPKISPDEIPFEPFCYITSRPIPNEWTMEWIAKNGFSQTKVYSVPFGVSKVEIAKSSGLDIFVDDRFENFVELNKAGICTYLLDAPHNKRYNVGHKRIYHLKELV